MQINRQHASPRRRSASPKSRRGAAIILVLGLLAITLATTFALTRTQFRAFQIHGNSRRRTDARYAAMNGLDYALRRMHDSDWGGVDATYRIDVSDSEWFEVRYATGDAALQEADPDYARYPYRVTLTSVGYSRNPTLPASPASYKTTAVVELIPRQISSGSPSWADANSHTVRQWHASSSSRFQVEPRFRIEGPVHVQGNLQVCGIAPLDWNARKRWIEDVTNRYEEEGVDHRLFNSQVDIDFSRTSSSTRDLLTDEGGFTLRDIASDDTTYVHPGLLEEYQLYPGGKVYSPTRVGAWLSNVDLKADVHSNPLGLFVADGDVTFGDNVSLKGVFVGTNDLYLDGENIQLRNVAAPVVEGDSDALRLPTLLISDDLRIESGATGQLQGMFATWDDFELKASGQNSSAFDFDGRLLCKELLIRARNEWQKLDSWWEGKLTDFEDQEDGGEELFPKWLESASGLPAQPILTIRPESGGVSYHWQDWSRPLFASHPDDEGLRWEVIRWGENP